MSVDIALTMAIMTLQNLILVCFGYYLFKKVLEGKK